MLSFENVSTFYGKIQALHDVSINVERGEIVTLIGVLRDEHDVTVLLIEHDMKLVMSISDHIYVINQGTPLADGTPQQVHNNPDVIKAYLGEA